MRALRPHLLHLKFFSKTKNSKLEFSDTNPTEVPRHLFFIVYLATGGYDSWCLEVCCLLFRGLRKYCFLRTQGHELCMPGFSKITWFSQLRSIFRTKKKLTKNSAVSGFMIIA